MAAEKINISNYELEKLARHLLPQIQKDLKSGRKNKSNRLINLNNTKQGRECQLSAFSTI